MTIQYDGTLSEHYQTDNSGNKSKAWGATVPSDAATGYAKDCVFTETDATDGLQARYVNVGDETSAEFVAVQAADFSPAGAILAVGEFTTAGGDADETITIAGLLATDYVLVTLHTAGATPRTIIDAQAAAGQIDVDMSGDPSTDHVLSYVAIRPPLAA